MVAESAYMFCGYDPPAGWNADGHVFSSSDPANPACIAVLAAYPLAEHHARVVARLVRRQRRAGRFRGAILFGPEEIRTQHGMVGHLWRLHGTLDDEPDWVRLVAVFAGGVHVYRARLDTPRSLLPKNRPAFLAVARSLRALPVAAATLSERQAAVGHWVG